MPTPWDSPQVLSALRSGWYVAEVRGRNRPGGLRSEADPLSNRRDHVQPMRIERTDPEQRIEAQAVLCKLAGDLGVDALRTQVVIDARAAGEKPGQHCPIANVVKIEAVNAC